jgi:hypothetical protein
MLYIANERAPLAGRSQLAVHSNRPLDGLA